jgi:hypothetical protein
LRWAGPPGPRSGACLCCICLGSEGLIRLLLGIELAAGCHGKMRSVGE